MFDDVQVAMIAALGAFFVFRHLAPAIEVDVKWGEEVKKKVDSWKSNLSFKKGGGSAPSPDPNIGKAALEQAKLGKDWLKFAEEQFAVGNKRQEELDALSKKVTESQLGAQENAKDWSEKDRARYEDIFQPMEDELIQEAKDYDSAERQQEVSSEARADVIRNSQAAKEAAQRQQASMGVNPNSGRFQATSQANDTQVALSAAGAENAARNQVRDKGYAMRADAVNMGKGLPSQAAGAAGLGLQAGSSAMGNAMSANSAFHQNNQIMGQGFSGAMQGQAGMAGTLNNLHSSQLSAWGAQKQADATTTAGLMSGIGMLGGAAVAASSKSYKKDKKKSKDNLNKLEKMPVENWRYKKGIQDGGAEEHTGPYAEDFKAATGIGTGKEIPLQDAVGLTMGAVQELSSKVDKLSKKKGGK